jgi:hypothetical protein
MVKIGEFICGDSDFRFVGESRTSVIGREFVIDKERKTNLERISKPSPLMVV